MINLRLWVALGLVLACSAASADPTRTAIEVANASLAQALVKGDAKAAAQHYTTDAIVIPPGGQPARGSAAIEAFWTAEIARGIKDVKLTTIDVETSGDLACEFGSVAVTGSDLKTSQAHYVVVWKRDGTQWKLHRDIWN